MGECNIDHSVNNVQEKLESQKASLPEAIYNDAEAALHENQTQETLNELFHLLKKYDLADQDEQEKRNAAMQQLLHNEQ
ncbi:hypothetical protein [Alteribacillus sp. HJP-4]|uniref:hypothetical protein n=1 Tax=Alteribacillus sp. HJP-4 TaxID=2775394 RepID=UPI0035CD2D56